MRWTVRRPDVPPDLDVSALQLVHSDEERREIYARIDQPALAETAANCDVRPDLGDCQPFPDRPA